MFSQKRLTVKTWVLYTSLGWIIGIALLLLVAAAAEALRFGGQWMVGLGMSTGIGFMQWLVLKKAAYFDTKWVLLSVLGFTIPFLLCEWLAMFVKMKPEVYVPVGAVTGSLLCGWLQYRYILVKISERAKSWIIYNFAGWGLATLIEFYIFSFNIHLPRWIDIPLAFASVFIGGPILGLVTGRAIVGIIGENSSKI